MVDICRLCASLRKVDILVTVRDESNEICEKLVKCCQLKIKINDGLPKSICQECILNLNISHRFYTKVQEAQETLQALYPSTNVFIQQTLSSQIETSKYLTSEETQEEQNTTNETKYTEKNKQEMKLESYLFEQFKVSANESSNEKESEQVNNVEEINICEKITYEDTDEIVEQIEDKEEDLEENNCSHAREDNQVYQDQFVEEDEINNQAVQYDLDISKEDYLQTNEVIEQINDLLSDDEVNIEIEYMEYIEEDEDDKKENEDMSEQLANIIESKQSTISTHELEINSWKEYKFLCFICDDIFNSFIDLKSHIAEEHNVKQLEKLRYKCYDCRKLIPRYSFFLNHVRAKHHTNLKLKCDACDLSCQDYEELARHRSDNCAEAIHFVETTACNSCFKSFNNTYGLHNHIKFQHNSTAKVIYKCSQCDKEFNYKSCLKSHERLHLDIKDFSCDYCEKSFYSKLGLEQHLYVHVEEKSYVCNICNKSYKTFKSLDDHKQLHTKEKAFKCQFCSKVFSRKIQKITHERSHTGEKPFSCEQCDKKFRYRSALFVHNKIHTGNKPYLCEYCEKTFADSSNRNKHVRRMHAHDKMQEN